MNFRYRYYNNPRCRAKPVEEANLRSIGDWRSRWERKRDLDAKDPKKDHIKRICTRGTDKDYVVTCVHGVSPRGLYFVGTPEPPDKPAPKSKGNGSAAVYVNDPKKCEDCGNYRSTVPRKSPPPARPRKKKGR